MSTMKPSGIDWIGEIPSEWDVIRMKLYAYLKGRIGWQGLKAEEFIDEGPYLVTGTDFENGRICWERSYHISEKRYEEAPQIQLRVGDLLVTKDGTIGKLAYVDSLPGKASLNSHLLLIRPLKGKFCNEYLYWVLGSSVFQGYYELTGQDGTTMDSLSQEKIGNFNFATPPLPEQQSIATFLYDRCGYIDGIIADLERQLEILRQYKKALITETVTKGLDKSVPMKPVGYDAADEVPAHWVDTRVKYLCDMQSGTAITTDEIKDDGDYPVYGGNGLRGYYEKFNTNGEYVLVGRQGALCGNVHIVTGKFWASDHAVVTYPYANVVNKFLYYLFIALNFNQYSTTAAQPGLAVSTIQRVAIAIPPSKKEQAAIVEFLDAKCVETDALIAEKLRSVEIMRQYKRSLIYEYVTGKKRVAG